MIDNPVVTAAPGCDAGAALHLWLSDAGTAAPQPATQKDRDQLARLHLPRRRQEWLLSRALLCEQVPAGQYHSLSHSGGQVAVLTTTDDVAIGVDLEALRPRPWLRHAEIAFCATEAEAVRRAHPARQPGLFLALWTLKEALAKALGLELMQALAQCRFQPDASGRWSGQVPTDRPWSAQVFTPRPDLTLAVACIGDARPCLHPWHWPRSRPARWPVLATCRSECQDQDWTSI